MILLVVCASLEFSKKTCYSFPNNVAAWQRETTYYSSFRPHSPSIRGRMDSWFNLDILLCRWPLNELCVRVVAEWPRHCGWNYVRNEWCICHELVCASIYWMDENVDFTLASITGVACVQPCSRGDSFVFGS